MSLLDIKSLTIRIGRKTILNSLSFSIKDGICGLLGPNGAGKTTLIKSLLMLIKPVEGQIKLEGIPLSSDKNILDQFGYMPERDSFMPEANGVEYLCLLGNLSGLPLRKAVERAHEVMEYVNLGEARYRAIGSYSTGMKQRIKLAGTIIHSPKLLLLDEPTSGMDPRGRDDMLELIRGLGKKGFNILLSSHILKDVEEVCSSVIILNRGEIADSGIIADLKKTTIKPYIVSIHGSVELFRESVMKRGMELYEVKENIFRITISNGENTRIIFESAKEAACTLTRLVPAETSLEEIFIKAIGEDVN